MSSTGVRETNSNEKRVIKGLIKNEEAFIQSLRVFANTSTISGLGATEGEVNNSPNEASGNYLSKSGDTMIGQFGNNFDTITATNLVDDTLDVSKSTGITFPVVILQGEGLTDDDLVTIIQGEDVFPFQELWIRTRVNIITVKNSDNVNTPDGGDLVLPVGSIIKLIFDTFLGEWVIVGGNAVAGSGGGTTGTFISADLTADQITNLAVNDHIEFDRNATPTGADGGIVLQTGAGQANGIFELKAGKTYFLSAGVAPFFGATNHVEFVWYDITNGTELGRRTIQDDAVLALDQPKAEITFTPLTDVNVEFRLVASTTPANLNGYDAEHTFANIFEFSGKNGNDGAAGAVTWKTPARAKTLVDVPDLSMFDVITDGITLVENDRVLLTEQVTSSENGLYVVGVVAGGIAPLTRPSDFDTDVEVLSETFVAIEEGSLHKNQLWHLITNNPILIDVTGQLWEVFAPGTSGGPNIGGDAGGEDATGQFVYDGRIAIGFDRLKRWEQINDFLYPDNGPKDLIYLPSQFANPTVNGRLVMCGDSNQTRGASYSDNYGSSWTLSTGISSNDNFIRMAYDPIGDVLVVVATNASNQVNAIRRSTDRGTSFVTTALAAGTYNFQDVIWSADDSLFVAVESTTTTTNRIYTSPDGNTWTQRTTPAALVGGWFRLAYNSTLDLYVVLGNSSTDVMTSPDAIIWTIGVTNLSISLPRRIIASDGQSKFVAMMPTPGTGGTYHSSDGINWIQFNTMPNVTVIENLLWAPDLSLWLTIGTSTPSSAEPPIFWASNDAETWFQMPINTMRQNDEGIFGVGTTKIAVAYAEEWGYFFGCGGDATVSGPFTANALFWRTAIFFNGQDNA